jgi:hypothetical protein
MFKRLGYYLLVITALVGMASLPAKADQILDFACGGGGTACTGSVASGGGYSTTGIGVSANFEPADPFSLVFNTSSNTISIWEGGTQEFVGTITNLAVTTGTLTTLDLGVNWTQLPSDVNGSQGITPFPSGSVVDISFGGSALSVDIPIVATPEPSALLLLAAGLVGLGLLVKFKGALVA